MKAFMLFSATAAYFFLLWPSTRGDGLFGNPLSTVPKNNMTVLQNWQKMEKQVKDTVNAGLKAVLPMLMENFNQLNMSRECLRNSMHLMSGIKEIRPWAMRFLDSSSKIIDGILEGSFTSFGSYDECINIEVLGTKLSNKGKLLFTGQYCMIDMKPYLPPKQDFFDINNVPEELKNFSQRDTIVAEISRSANIFHLSNVRMAVCVPSGCSREDINKIAELIGDAISMNARATRCESKEEKKYEPLVIFSITCYSILGLLMLIGTAIDLYSYYTKEIFQSKFMKSLLAFSFYTNFKTFIDTSQKKITCLDGIRVISMSWIITAHSYLTLNPNMVLNVKALVDEVAGFFFQVVLNGTLSVDTFFCMGGMLLSYLTIKHCVLQKEKFPIFQYIVHRLLRLFPPYIFIIIGVYSLNLFGSGPLWHETTSWYIEGCQKNWWANLIFINNFLQVRDQCMNQAWYIGADFQLYIGALIIIIPLIRWPKVGKALAVLGIFGSIIFTGIYTYVYNLPPTVLFSKPDMVAYLDTWIYVYSYPFSHITSYCIGILVGYLLIMKPDLKIPKVVQVLGWCISITLCMITVYGPREWNRGVEPLRSSAILYAASCRTAWALGIAWMITCCATGHGGIVNHILSWKVWIPISRLTFSVYLIHPIVQLVYIGSHHTHIQFDQFIVVWMVFGYYCVSYGIAFCIFMLVELPFVNLEKLYLPARGRKVEKLPVVNEAFSIDSNLEKDKVNGNGNILPKADEESGEIPNGVVTCKL